MALGNPFVAEESFAIADGARATTGTAEAIHWEVSIMDSVRESFQAVAPALTISGVPTFRDSTPIALSIADVAEPWISV